MDPASANNSATDTDAVLQAPQITSQPSSVTVTAPASATFSVAATGTAPLSYQWRQNGVAISGATGASYTLDASAATDNGAQFDVVVSNAAGTATSLSATLTVTTSANTQLTSPADPLPYAVDYNDNLSGSEYAVAVWTAPNPADSLLFVTQKSLNVVQVWSLQTNQIVQTLTGFNKPLGVAVDQAEAALYVTSQSGQAVYKYFIANIVAGNLSPALTFGQGMSPSSQPSGITVFHGAGGVTRVFVVYTGSSTKFVRAFDTNGTLQSSWNMGSLALNEIAADDENGVIYVADQTNAVIKVFGADGTFERDFGQGTFASDVEGLAVYRCGASGYVVASNQSANAFEIFDRVTFAHLATFTVQSVRDTIGVALTQAAVPGYPNGGLFVESRGREVFGVQWDAVAAATAASVCPAQ
jgi:myo-inositol-hexaphosphate 3-phosphohydrolase